MVDQDKIPKVSVLIPSYNHAKYVGQAIESVLNQTFQDFEIVITDDGSSDNSVEVIERIKDSRIRLFKFENNRGPAHAVFNSIQHARGEYYALLNSDDMWHPEKLEKQVGFLDANHEYGAVFSDVQFIYEDGRQINSNDYYWAQVFQQKNRSRGRWLRRFFFELNCICHPSVLIRCQYYNDPLLHNDALRQLPDFNLWIETVKKTEIHIMEERLVLFRVLTTGENTSADTPVNRIRNINEIYLILHRFFDNVTRELLLEGFEDFLIHPECPDQAHLECEKAFLYLKMDSELTLIYQLVGMKKLYQLLQQPETRATLKNSYKFTERDFYILTGKVDVLQVMATSANPPWYEKKQWRLIKRLRNFIKHQVAKFSYRS